MAQLTDLFSEFKTFIPWVSFVAGMGGSLHCVGMCGGLVASSCESKTDIGQYQIGRLIGYLLLGALAGLMGQLLTLGDIHPWFTFIPSFLVGGLFIFWGVRSFQGKKAELPLPRFLQKIYQLLWFKVNRKMPKMTKAFFTGFISIMLPCGLLYGVIAATVAVQDPFTAMLGMFFFWLGTVPSMVFAPGIVKKILAPLKSHRPKVYAISLVLVGLLTVGTRLVKQVELHSSKAMTEKTVEKKSCH